ncbi:MAG TPA: enoyl-CoA hydratase [Methylomirabilota bacterium]|nr:enoyl-CoA hydratase [Methylomirabilota bacterium]
MDPPARGRKLRLRRAAADKEKEENMAITEPITPARAPHHGAQETGARPPVLEATDAGIRRITLDAPATLNLLTLEMMGAIEAALGRAGADPDVRVVVIAATGKAFCAGHDLKGMAARRTDPDGGRAAFTETFDRCSQMMLAIVDCPRPVIAEVHAVAAAAGCQMVAACDMAVAADTARFGTTGVSFGLFCSTPAVPLSRVVERKAALEMLFTGDLVDAARAREIGLVNKVVPAAELTAATTALAARIARQSPLVLALGKRGFYEQAGMSLREAYHHASAVMVENLMTADGEEGIAAFIEKRPPEWTGR